LLVAESQGAASFSKARAIAARFSDHSMLTDLNFLASSLTFMSVIPSSHSFLSLAKILYEEKTFRAMVSYVLSSLVSHF